MSATSLDAPRHADESANSLAGKHAHALGGLFGPDRLPRKPRCTNDPGAFGTRVLPLELAIGHRYIQYNRPGKVTYLVFDVDRPGAVFSWMDAHHLPPPNWTCENPLNRHAHLVYVLEDPVVTSAHEHQHPARYVAAIEAAYLHALRADAGFTSGLTKNPLHRTWRTELLRPRPYSLAELAEYVDLRAKHRHRLRSEGALGRNCQLFDTVRFWAYRAVLSFRLGGSGMDDWLAHVREEAHGRNVFIDAPSLPHREVDHLAKSIAKWTWRHYTGCGSTSQELKASQSRRGRMKGASVRADGLTMLSSGSSVDEVSRALSVTARTVYNWAKRLKVSEDADA